MSIRITYFVHGTTTDNEQGIASGWRDVELSELGVRQSMELRKMIDVKQFDRVFCSDLKRAVHTAQIVFETDAHITPDARLRECNYGVESNEDVQVRIADFLEYIKKHFDGKHIAIVAHKFPQLALDVLLKGKTWEQAIAQDWRLTKSWQPGWEYEIQ